MEEQELDYKALYEQELQKSKRAEEWDKWYSYYIAPKYGDSREFHAKLMEWLETPEGGRVQSQAQRETQQAAPQVAQQAEAHFQQQAAQVQQQAQNEGRNITQEEVNWLLQQRDAYYQQTLQSLYQRAVQDAVQTMREKVLPEHFDIYDKVSLLRTNKLGNNEEEYRKLISHMIEKGEKDPSKAYEEVYGERDRKKELEKMREEIRAEEKARMKQEASKREVSVLKTNGTFPLTPKGDKNTENATKSMEDIKSDTLNEVVAKYGTQIL